MKIKSLIISLVITSFISCKKEETKEEEFVIPAGWEQVASPNQKRYNATLVAIPGNKAVLIGGRLRSYSINGTSYSGDFCNGEQLMFIEEYDGNTNTWTNVVEFPVKSPGRPNVSTLSNGELLIIPVTVCGNLSDDPLADKLVYRYNPQTKQLTKARDLPEKVSVVSNISMGNNKTYIHSDKYIGTYNAITDSYKGFSDDYSDGLWMTGLQLTDTSYMTCGGDKNASKQINVSDNNIGYGIYNAKTVGGRSGACLVKIENSKVLIFGGSGGSFGINAPGFAEAYNFETNEVTTLGNCPMPIVGVLGYTVGNGTMLAFDQYCVNNGPQMFTYHIANDSWAELSTPTRWNNGAATMLSSGKLLLVAAYDKNEPTQRFYDENLYEVKTFVYTP